MKTTRLALPKAGIFAALSLLASLTSAAEPSTTLTGLAATYFFGETLGVEEGSQRPRIIYQTTETPDFADLYGAHKTVNRFQQLFFSALWVGSIQAPATGEYVFRTIADDGARLIVDGQLIVDRWLVLGGQTTDAQPMKMESGKRYLILLEYRKYLGKSAMILQWRKPGASDFEAVPAECLSPEIPAAPLAATRVRFFPRAGSAAAMKGGRFTGSNFSEMNSFVPLAVIENVPPEGQWTELPLTGTGVYRYLKYEAPPASHGNIAELEFDHGDHKLTGKVFGTAGARNNGTTTFDKAMDGSTSTYFDSLEADNQYVGIDLGAGAQVSPPVFEPAPNNFPKEIFVKLSTPTPHAFIRYTTNGQEPTLTYGTLYTQPFPVSQKMTVTAKAFSPALGDSVVALGAYDISAAPLKKGLRVFFTGNSLTDGFRKTLKPFARSAGIEHFDDMVGAAGAPTDWLWNTANMNQLATKKLTDDAPLDFLITQPFGGHGRSVENETAATGNFFELARQNSPNIKICIYQQWPSAAKFDTDCWGSGNINLWENPTDWQDSIPKSGEQLGKNRRGGAADKLFWLLLPPPKSWDDAILNQVRYFDVLRENLARKYPQTEVRIIPGGLALLRVKQLVDAGKFPSLDPKETFFTAFFSDGLHLNPRGNYIIALTHLACLYNMDPTGKVTSAGTGLTEEQARVIQQAVWKTVRERKDYICTEKAK